MLFPHLRGGRVEGERCPLDAITAAADASPAPASRSRNLTERPLALWLLEE